MSRGRITLQLKLSGALILLVLTPLLVSAYLADQLSKVAANFAAGEAAERLAPMANALSAYRELFDTTKRLHGEVADRVAQAPSLLEELPRIVEREPGVIAIRVRGPDGKSLGAAVREAPRGGWQRVEVERAVPEGTVTLTFVVRAGLQREYQELKEALDSARRVSAVRTALPAGYRLTFLALIGVATFAAVALGVMFSAAVTRRIGALVSTARKVSAGKLDARVELSGKDEMAELGSAFNTMLDDLESTRQQITYLQRIGAWQDVARRLAHEIKNPLTPIQLAVQQCVSSYRGDDERFARMLRDTGEIVEEEIAALRRLVDTFRTLGQLPKVEATPLPLAELIEELRLDPAMAQRLALSPPSEHITVFADKLLLKRVLANLVENAMHAGDEAGRRDPVMLTWKRKGALIELTVDDHGRGVAAADRERIFEPYVTTKATGTGLGLAIAKKIALEHGGDLTVAEAPAPTGGARFVVTLPDRKHASEGASSPRVGP